MYKIKASQTIPKIDVRSPTSVSDIPPGVNFDMGKTPEQIELPAGQQESAEMNITLLAALNKQRLAQMRNSSHHALGFLSGKSHTNQPMTPEAESTSHIPHHAS